MTVVRPLVPVKKGGEALDAKQSILIGYQNSKAAAQQGISAEEHSKIKDLQQLSDAVRRVLRRNARLGVRGG